jgi:hypothetical protein
MKSKKTDPAKTMLTLTVALLLISLSKKWDLGIKLSLVIGAIGIFSTYLSVRIDRAWMKLADVMSSVFPPLLLGAVFYIFIFPVSLLFRFVAKKDPLLLRNKEKSTFRGDKKDFDKPSFERTW